MSDKPLTSVPDPVQDRLATAYVSKERLSCKCTVPGAEMYIAKANGRYWIKRMPNTGHLHAQNCKSFDPPEELSGLCQVNGTAILHDGETTHLKLDFPLTLRGKRGGLAPSPSAGSLEVLTIPSKLKITALLHFLWHDSELTKWDAGSKEKRNWRFVRSLLKQACKDKISKKLPLASRVFVPETFSVNYKDEIAKRRNALFAPLKLNLKGETPLGVLIGEYKSHERTNMGAKFTFKHLPDCKFFAQGDLTDRFEKVYQDQLLLVDMMKDIHPMLIATFYVNANGFAVLQDIGLMLTSQHWIPFEGMRELELIDQLTKSRRNFIQQLRFNLAPSIPIASSILIDTQPPTALFVQNGEETALLTKTAADGTYPGWTFLTEQSQMPELPEQTIDPDNNP